MPKFHYTKATFILAAQKIHGNLYSYSKVDYINGHTKVKIICKNHDEFYEFEQMPRDHLRGKGCDLCGGTKKYTLERFIKEANIIHNNKYNYSKSLYTTSKDKIIIICPNHDEPYEFAQIPSGHLSGKGCIKCSGTKIKTLKEFINDAVSIHGNEYRYINTNYINSGVKTKIFCNNHQKEFDMLPSNHLAGQGCPDCSGKKKKTTKEFINISTSIHKGKYSYNNSNYLSAKKLIKITCPIHGDFNQIAHEHMNGAGCSKCSKNKKKTTEEFIENCIKIHGNLYIYDKVIYTGDGGKITITCKEHKEFEQMAGSHLAGHGCPKCCNRISKKETEWLDLLSIINRQNTLKINSFKNKQKLDGYDSINNIIYEFHGDYYHAHPSCKQCMKRDRIHPHQALKDNKIKQKTNAQIYADTLYREQKIKETGYKLVVIWEHEFNALKAMYGNDSQLFEKHIRSHTEYQLMYYNE